MNEIFIVIIVGLVGIIFYLYKQQKSFAKTVDDYKDKLDENNELLNKKILKLQHFHKKSYILIIHWIKSKS